MWPESSVSADLSLLAFGEHHRMEKLKMTVFLAVLFSGNFSSFGYALDTTYKIEQVIELPAIKSSQTTWDTEIATAKQFSEALVNAYFEQIRNEIPLQFREDSEFWRGTHISAKVIFSTFAETLLYLYPDERNRIVADVIDVPIQIAFLGGLIPLENPQLPTDTSSVKCFVPLNVAKAEYAATPTSFINQDSGIRIAGPGTVRFTNAFKIITFHKNSIFGFFGGWIEIDNTGPEIAKLYGRPVHFKFQTLGPFLLTGERDFSWAMQEARSLGISMAGSGIQNFFTKSKFFQQALTHEKLKGQADVILKKHARSKEDPAIDYPLWQFKQDWERLKESARAHGYDSEYLDELKQLRPPGAGYLFWYYETYSGFVWQWICANLVIGVVLVVVWWFRRSEGFWGWLFSFLRGTWWGKVSLPGAVFGVNAFIFTSRPSALTLLHWTFPGILFGVNMIVAISIGAQSNFKPEQGCTPNESSH